MSRFALITGATKGIGAALVEAFIERQFEIIAVAKTQQRLDQLTRRFNSIHPFVCDVASVADVTKTFEAIRSVTHQIDVMINNAGIGYFEPITETSIEHWQQTIGINLTGAFLMTQRAIPLLRQSDRPHIFNIVSTAGKKGFPNCGAYSASKFGLLGFTEVLREEMRAFNIKVTAVIPGAVNTPFWEEQNSNFDTSKMLETQDVAKAVLFAYEQSLNNTIEEITLKPSIGDF
ncbi:SDR family NAD(P)-dependent oxidoreductase [bacterium]|nr:SDR family NAD(P)-dependent oxidoreductase [bacterium]